MTSNTEEARNDEARFMQMVAMFQFAAMQQMGKLANPVSGEIERDLDQSRMSIDLLEMLQRKTQGNRSDAEEELLGKVLFELRMNYVDEVERAAKAGTETPSEETPADSTGADPAEEESKEEETDT